MFFLVHLVLTGAKLNNHINLCIEELYSVYLTEVTVDSMQKFLPQLLSKLYIEAIIYGNVSKQVL